MAKMSLAIKYRPKTFDDVCEQGAIKDILLQQLNTGGFQHAYLFCGPAGCGKTTAARIFANDINKGRGSPIEIDAASNSGVDNIRTVIEDAKKKSLDSEYTVYIVDECHSLSNGAWQAMLKLLEEPPKYTIFILCTTDPQKIPATIISRVQRYNFSKISTNTIVQRLKYIMESEAEEITNGVFEHLDELSYYSYDTEAIEYIAKMADGGMRDAITMLDKCVSLSNCDLTLEDVVKALGTVDYGVHFDLFEALYKKDGPIAIKIIEDIYSSGRDIKIFIKQFYYFLIDVCKYEISKTFEYIQIPQIEEYKTRLDAIPKSRSGISPSLQCLSLIGDVVNFIKWESNPRYIIEASILNYLATNSTKIE